MDMFLMTLRALDFMDIFAMCVFLGIWFYIAYLLINAYFSSLPRKGASPSALDGRGQFIHKVEQDENERLADMAESR